MDTAMRDLDQLEEYAPGEFEGRRAGVLVLGALVLLGVIYAVGHAMGTVAAPEITERDPLDALDPGNLLAQQATVVAPAEEHRPVDRQALAFPSALLDDDRPEVAATFAALEAEHAALLGGAPSSPADEPPVIDEPEEASPVRSAAPAAVTPVAPALAALPAGTIASSEGAAVAQEAARDPMVAAAVVAEQQREEEEAAESESSENGPDPTREGEFCLQVVSYRTRAEADTFVGVLRGKDHPAFVETAEVEGRGTFYRVRLGPFRSRHRANIHRRRFEREERMDTFIVRRPREDS